MKGAREYFASGGGKTLAIGAAVVAVVLLVWVAWANFRNSDAATANERIFIDATTGKPYNLSLKAGMAIPAAAPSGKETGYPAELCYWTADGKPKDEPTPVLLNEWAGKAGPTFCPDCKRLVVGHNPRPGPGRSPPPTEAEYATKHKPGQREGRGQ